MAAIGNAPATVTFERPADRADELKIERGRGRERDRVRFLELAVRRFVMIDGEGAPGEETFAPRMPGLYGTAYPLRFALKRRGVIEKVGPLEGLWWTTDGTTDLDRIFGEGERGTWRWILMIGLPDGATDEELEAALASARAKLEPRHAASLRIEPFAEGRVAQIVHFGPYATERATIERLHAAIGDAGLRPRGRHHEIYMGDPRRGSPENIKTILRQPVE